MEISYINDVGDVMDLEESWLKYAFSRVNDKHGTDIKRLYNVELSDLTIKFPRIRFSDAKQIIKDKYHYEAYNKDDFERKEEELISKYAKETYGTDFVFVTHYPYATRPFYSMKDTDGYTKTFDLIYKGLEITSGAQREHRYEVLKQQVEEKGIDPESLSFYLDFFKYGCPPHGGLGFGIARLLMQMLNIDNIREATFIYRGPTRLKP